MRPRPTSTAPKADDHDPYADLPALYDLEHDAFQEDVSLYLNFAEVVGDPILELGCGTGRLLAPLADAGWRITGTDRSAAMLARAEQRLGKQDRVQLVQAEMTDADRAPGGPFGLVIIGLNGLMHLADATRQREVLASTRRALDPRGQIIVDVINPDHLSGVQDQGVVHEGRWRLPDGTQVDKFSTRRIRRSEQLIETDLWYDRTGADGTVIRTTSSFPLRYLHRHEIELMLELAGFAEWNVYGGYELEPFDDGAERLIVTADVTPST